MSTHSELSLSMPTSQMRSIHNTQIRQRSYHPASTKSEELSSTTHLLLLDLMPVSLDTVQPKVSFNLSFAFAEEFPDTSCWHALILFFSFGVVAAVVGITKSAADYLGPAGIRVCCVSPSIVATVMNGPHIVCPALEVCKVFSR